MERYHLVKVDLFLVMVRYESRSSFCYGEIASSKSSTKTSMLSSDVENKADFTTSEKKGNPNPRPRPSPNNTVTLHTEPSLVCWFIAANYGDHDVQSADTLNNIASIVL